MKLSLPNLALFKRTLLMDNRHWQGYLARFFLLGTIFFMLCDFADRFRYATFVGAPGLDFLRILCGVDIVAVSFLGVVAFVPAITEEKESDSLGLLLMTGLSPMATILSKGGGKFLAGVALILAQVPFTFLAVTLGGVSPTHIAAAYAVVLSYMFLVAGLALFLSVLCSKTAVAGGLCLSILLAFNVLLPINEHTIWLSPFDRMSEIFSTGFQGPVVTLQTAVYAATGLFFYLAGWLVFDFCVRSSGGDTPIRLKMSPDKRFRPLALLYPGRVWRNALAWKAFHFDAKGWLGAFSSLALLCVIIGFMWYFQPSYNRNLDFFGESMLALGFIALFVELAHVSGAIFGSEIASGSLAALLLLPRSRRYVFYSKILGASLITLPILLIIAVGMLIKRESVMDALGDEGFYSVAIVLASASLLYFHLTAFLSLFIKYGAFIVAGFALFLMYMLAGFVLAAGGGGAGSLEAFVVMFCSIHTILVFAIHMVIGEKLRLWNGP